jgi:Secretion system C-terminal sorting domain/Beta-propeller repeat
MKKQYFLIIAFLLSIGINAQTTPYWVWAKTAAGAGDETPTCIATDDLGNVYIAGKFNSPSLTLGAIVLTNNNAPTNDIFLVKYTAQGDVIWAKSFGAAGDEAANAIAVDASGNIYLTGEFNSNFLIFDGLVIPNQGSTDIFTVMLNTSGAVQWGRSFGGRLDESGLGITKDNNGNVILCGYVNSDTISFGSTTWYNISNSPLQSVVLKMDALGNPTWVRLPDTATQGNNIARGITTDNNGNIYITGEFSNNVWFPNNAPLFSAGGSDVYVTKYSTAGSPLWSKRYGSTGTEGGIGIKSDMSNNIYITGNYTSPTVTFGTTTALVNTASGGGSSDLFVVKIDANGGPIWATSGGGAYDDYATGICTDNSGNVAISANYGSQDISFGTTTILNTGYPGNYDLCVAQFNGSGTLNFVKAAGVTTFNDYCAAIATDISGNIYATGSFFNTFTNFGNLSITNSNPLFYSELYLAKILKMPTPAICQVTVDEASVYNEIYWDKTLFAANNIDSVIIYRETTINTYKRIAAIADTALSVFVDTVRSLYFPFTGDPNSGKNRYKIQLRDTIGNTSVLSPWHQTVFDNVTGGVHSFNDYAIEGVATPVPQLNAYLLERDDNNTGAWAAIAGNSQSPMNDPNYLSYPFAAWRIRTDWSIACDPSRININTTRSNIKKPTLISGIAEANNMEVVIISPNPANQLFVVTSATAMQMLVVYNTLGEIVYKNTNQAQQQKIEVSTWNQGVYFVEITNAQGRVVKKLVKE